MEGTGAKTKNDETKLGGEDIWQQGDGKCFTSRSGSDVLPSAPIRMVAISLTNAFLERSFNVLGGVGAGARTGVDAAWCRLFIVEGGDWVVTSSSCSFIPGSSTAEDAQ